MKYFSDPTEPGDLDQLQYRIAVIFVLLTLASIVFFGISDYLLGLSPFIGRVRVVYAVLFVGCFYLMVRKKRYQLSINLMAGLILTFSLLNYFYNDGYRGPTIFNLLVYVAAVAIFFKKPMNVLWFFLAIGSYLLVFYLEVWGFALVVYNYTDAKELFWDNALSLTVSALFIFIGIFLVIVNYQRQHRRLSELKRENERHLAELSELNEKKNQLIAVLSHDLKSPIASLGSSLSLAEQNILERGDLELVFSELKKQSLYVQQVLDNTLDWVLTEMDDRRAEQHTIILSRFNEDMCKIMQVQADNKQQLIHHTMLGPDREVSLEVNEIRIVLKNLLENAIKFSANGSHIELELKSGEEQLCWEVRNPGSKLGAGAEAKLFELKATPTQGTGREKGSGVGLSLCRKIAQKLDMELGYQYSDGQHVFFLRREKRYE